MASRSDPESVKLPPPRALSVDVLAGLFERLAGIFGQQMSQAFEGIEKNSRKEWSEALAAFSAEEIENGIIRCRTKHRGYAPNLPEFLHLCRPSLDPEIAWIEAERGLKALSMGTRFTWSHVAVYWAAKECSVDIRTRTYSEVKKKWEYVLGQQFAAGSWEPIPSTPRAENKAESGPEEKPVSDPVAAAKARAALRSVVDQMRAKKRQ